MLALRHSGTSETAGPHFWAGRDDTAERSSWKYAESHADPRELNEEELKRLSKERLVSIARNEALPNRSKMNKAQLARTLRKHFRRRPK